MRTRLATCAFIAAGALVPAFGVPVAVGATDRSSSHSELHPVEFALDADPASQPVVGEPAVGPDGRRITGITNINSVFSGDLSGTAFGAVFLAGNQAASGGGGVDIWTVTDSPCGAGTVVVNFAIHGQENSRTVGVWRIAPGTGTGDLETARGGGTLTVAGMGHDDWTGHIRCG